MAQHALFCKGRKGHVKHDQDDKLVHMLKDVEPKCFVRDRGCKSIITLRLNFLNMLNLLHFRVKRIKIF